MARQQRQSLILVHVVPNSIAYAPRQPDQALLWQTNQVTLAEAMLATEAQRPRELGLDVRTEATIGDAASLILERSREPGVALVVLGTHGRSEAARFFLGSVAETVVRAAKVPVLVTPAHDPRLERWEGQSPLELLVGSDGSAASRTALRWGSDFTAQRAVGLSLLRVYWPAEEALRYGLERPWGRPHPDEQLLRLIERDTRRDMDARLQEASGRIRFRVAARDAGEALNEEAAALGADAVAIAVPKHWSNRWALLDPGAVLRASSVPVFCVPETATADEIGAVHSVLLATDLSEASKAAILPAYRLVAATGGRVELCTVHVHGPVPAVADLPVLPALDEARRNEIESKLRALIPADAEARGITTSVSILEGRSVPETLIAAAERLAVDVVVLGTRGRSGLKRALLGSVADTVARTATRPVLLVHPHQEGY